MFGDLGNTPFLSAFGICFTQGLFSFFTPCVLPLIPVYLSFLSGMTFDQLQHAENTSARFKKVFGNTLLFVLGFSTIFILLGLGATQIGDFLNRYQRPIAFGAAIIILILALHFTGAYQISFLNYEKRIDIGSQKKMGPFSSFLFGLAFAFGWTPCIGPILASVLLIAAYNPQFGIFLLAAYAAGLAIPFLLTALFVNTFIGLLNRMKRHMELVELIIGSVLVLAAAYLMFNALSISLLLPLGVTALAMTLVIVLKLIAKIPIRWPALIVAIAMVAVGGTIYVGQITKAVTKDISQMGWVDAAGRPADLSTYQDRVVLLNFFASWCDPCKEEIPKLAQIYREHQKEGFAILGIDMDSDLADGVAFVKDRQVPYPVVYGNLNDLASFGTRAALPTNIILRTKPSNKVLKVYTGWPGENTLLADLMQFAK